MSFLIMVFAAASGYLLSRAVRVAHRSLVFMVIFTVLLLLPVHLLGALELAGWIGKIRLDTLVYIQAVVFAAAWLVSGMRTLPAEEAPVSAAGGWPRFLLFAALLVACSYLLFALDLMTSFPGGWDALAYHLPVSLRLLQEGTLRIPVPTVWQMSLPANAEIVMALLLGTGYQSLAPAINILAVIVLACATFIIAFRFAGNRPAALAVALVALTIPIVQFQAFAALVDLFGTAFLLAAVALFMLRPPTLRSTSQTWDYVTVIAISALSCGVSLGSKPIFLVFGGLFCLVALIASLYDFKVAGKTNPQLAALVVAFVIAVSAPCLFWFARGIKTTGNPVIR